jgi:hypothetical protein
VDHVGQPLPQQDRPDCAFYVLLRLITKLTGESPPPSLWQFITRILRCWTALQVYRRLLEDGAVADVRVMSMSRFESNAKLALHAKGQAVTPQEPLKIQQGSTVRGPEPLWGRAIAGLKSFLRRRHKIQLKEVKAKLLDGVLKDAAKQAAANWAPEARAMPRQLPTSAPVVACSTAPARVRAAKSGEQWNRRYHDVHELGSLPRVSMQNNPLRYFLMAERDKRGQVQGRRAITNPLSYYCIRHRGNLCVEQSLQRTDRLMPRSERAINFVTNPCSWPHLKEHMHAYLGLTHLGGKACVKPGRIHVAVRRAMESQIDSYGPQGRVAKTGKPYFDVLRVETSKTLRLIKPQKAAETRWGTRGAALQYLDLWGRIVSTAVIHAHGQGTEEALAETAERVFRPTGFVDPHKIRLPKRPGWLVHTLCNSTDILFFAIGGFVDTVMIRPMMDAMSHNLECSRCSVCGIDSIFRRLLHFLNGHLFVGMFNSGDSFTGSTAARARAAKMGLPFLEYKTVKDNRIPIFNKRRKTHAPFAVVKLAHRGVASLRQAHKCPFLINPKADVEGVFGRFCSRNMVKCVTTLLAGLRRAAMFGIDRPGPWEELKLYPTLEQKWEKEVAPSLKNDHMGPEVDCVPSDRDALAAWEVTQRQRFVRNMMKAQWAFAQIVADMTGAILKWFDRELFCPLGFIACAIQTRTVRARKETDGTIVNLLIANKFALANLMVAFKMLDELEDHYRINVPSVKLVDYVPQQLAALLTNEEAMLQAGKFCLAENIEGFVLVDKDGKDVKDKKGNLMPVGPAPVERFPELARLVCTMAFTVLSNNDPERAFTHASRGYRLGARNVTAMTISTWVRGRDWISGGFWGMEKNEDFIKSFAKWRRFVAAYYPRLQLLTMPNAHNVEQARMAAQLAKLPAKYKNGTLFLETNITASKDLFIFGSKPSGNDDTDEAPDNAKRDTGRLSSYGAKLCQRVRAKRALVRNRMIRKTLEPVVCKTPKKRKRGKSASERASQASAASNFASEGAKPDGHTDNNDQDHEMADGGSTAAMEDDGDTGRGGVAPDAAPSSNDVISSTESSEGAKPDGHTDNNDQDHEMADGGSTAAMEDDGDTGRGGVAPDDAAPSSNDVISSTESNTAVSQGTASGSIQCKGMQKRRRLTSQSASQASAASNCASEGAKPDGHADNNEQDYEMADGRAQTSHKETMPKSVDEHQSFIKAREWLASSTVKYSRESAKIDAKKDAASLRAAASLGAGCSSLSSDAADKSPIDECDSDSDSDAVWTPSTVCDSNREYVSVKRKVDGTTCRVNRGRKSGCILHHIYDDISGESQLVQIQSLRYKKASREWIMEYCRVYSGCQALTAAEQEEDTTVMVEGKGLVQRGRAWLRETLRTGKLQYHVGDVRRYWKVEYVLGICAWLPASALLCDRTQHAERKEELRKALMFDGISRQEAKQLADDPIYLGENFSEATAEQCSDSDGDSSESEPDRDTTSPGAIVVTQPSRGPLRELRARQGTRDLFEQFDVHPQEEDSDDIPLFADRQGVERKCYDGPSHGSGPEKERELRVGAGGGRGRGRGGAGSVAAVGDGADKGGRGGQGASGSEEERMRGVGAGGGRGRGRAGGRGGSGSGAVGAVGDRAGKRGEPGRGRGRGRAGGRCGSGSGAVGAVGDGAGKGGRGQGRDGAGSGAAVGDDQTDSDDLDVPLSKKSGKSARNGAAARRRGAAPAGRGKIRSGRLNI